MTLKLLVYLYILLIPFDGIKVLPISLSNIVLILIFVIYVFFGNPKLRLSFCWKILFIALAMLWIIGVTTVGLINKNYDTIKYVQIVFFTVLSFISLIVIPEIIGYNVNSFIKFFKVLLISSIISAFSGYYEYLYFLITGTYLNDIALMGNNAWLIRIKGFYFDQNYFSLILLLGFTITYILPFSFKRKMMLLIFFIIPIIFTFSRMAWLGLLFSLFLGWYFSIKNRVKKILFITIFFCLIFGFAKVGADYLFNARKESSLARVLILTKYTSRIIENPIFGYGQMENPDIVIDKSLKVDHVEAHNTFVQVLYFGGLISFSLIFVPLFYYVGKVYLQKRVAGKGLLIKDFITLFFPPFFLGLFFLSYLNIKYFWIFYLVVVYYLSLTDFEKTKDEKISIQFYKAH